VRRTRPSPAFTFAWKERVRQDQDAGLPVSVRGLDDTHVNRTSTGPPMACGPQQPSDFWDFLRSWGGEWMWEGVDDCQPTKYDLSWLIQGIEMNSLIWVTDGSYDRKCAPTISRVGWIIFCQMSSKWMVGSFWEKSPTASSYRAELLGLCSLHLFALALSEFYKVFGWKATLGCNNLCALSMSSNEDRRMKPSAACADIHRSLCATKKTSQADSTTNT
jgi:hypothetical protein